MLRLTETRGLAGVAGVGPGLAEPLDLLGLQLVERHPRVLGEKSGAHEVHALLSGPLRCFPGAGAPPDPVAEAVGAGLDPEQPGWVGEHRSWVRFGEAVALDHLEKDPGVLPSHIGVVGALGRHVAEVTVTLDDLLGRPTAYAELQAPAGDEVS